MTGKKKEKYEYICDEWKECRNSIARFDKTIVALRGRRLTF